MPDLSPLNLQFDDQKLLARIIDYYQRTLKETAIGPRLPAEPWRHGGRSHRPLQDRLRQPDAGPETALD